MKHDPRARLEDEGVRMRDWSVGNHRAVCPVCSSSRRKNKKQECLSVTVNGDGSIVYNCFHCDWSGCMGKGVDRLRGRERKNFKPPPPEKPKPPREPPRLKFEPPCDAARQFFADRCISTETVNAFRIGQVTRWMPGCDGYVPAIVFPYFVKGRRVNHKYRALERKSFIQDPGTRRTIYNIDRTVGVEEVVIVEGEMDVLAMHECGVLSAVTLPDGAAKKNNDGRMRALHESGLTERDDVRFVLAGDSDEPGLAMRKQLVKTLGAERCRIVTWPVDLHRAGEPVKDAGDCLKMHGRDAVVEAVRRAEQCA